VRERCERLWTILCDQWTVCGVITGSAANNCLAVAVNDCCTGAACVAEDHANPAQVDLCDQDLATASCALVFADAQGHTVPSSCQGLLF
jgi:hypothetical protein